MPETDATFQIEEYLKIYSDPKIEHLRPAVKEAWGRHFGDPELRDGILANPRLSRRIMQDIFDCLDLAETDKNLPSEFSHVTGLLLAGKSSSLISALGVAYYRSTVIDWLSWNSAPVKIPGCDLTRAGQIVMHLDPDVVSAAQIPASVFASLDQHDFGAAGQRCLNAWYATLPEAVFNRLSLLRKPEHGEGGEGLDALARDVARILVRLEDEDRA